MWSVIVDDGGRWVPIATGLTWSQAADLAIAELNDGRHARLIEFSDNY